ncbi:putative squalene monooxygenase [Medicago truncatula]|uniref:Squalene monooxygenase n=1 Tax=Medicago truncatula TaxID=3880 RepID=A0A396HEP4_MEDTR|nr:putative squalene monooxygenase [Medicago truncatula]
MLSIYLEIYLIDNFGLKICCENFLLEWMLWKRIFLIFDGRRVHVIERDLSEPDRIVGELLQPGGYLKLLELGLEDCVDGIDAQRVFGYALYKDGKNIKLSYPLENFNVDVSGRSFHNGRFIKKMREKASYLPKYKFLHLFILTKK